MKIVCLILACFFAAHKAFAQSSVPVFIYFGSHNETNDAQYHGIDYSTPLGYAQMRGYVKAVADTVIANHARWDMMLESNFILGCLKNESAHTNSNDLIEWADNTAEIEVEPHNHFKPTSGVGSNPYNYADLAYLLDSCGLADTSRIMGGFIWRNFTMPVALSEDWTQWQTPKQGYTFPFFRWKPTLIWGGGSPNHIDDYQTYGIWKPQAATTTTFGVHQPSNSLVCFGNGCGDEFVLWDTTNVQLLCNRIMNFVDTVNTHYAGNPNAFFTMKVMMNFRSFPSANFAAKVGQIIRTIKPYTDNGSLVWRNIYETYQTWQQLHPNAADYFNESCSNITRSNATPIYTDTRNIPISDEANEFAFYPNPAYQELSFVFKSKPQSGQDVFIFDALGRLCREGRVQDGDKMSIDKLTTGVYWVKTGAGVQKMVKL